MFPIFLPVLIEEFGIEKNITVLQLQMISSFNQFHEFNTFLQEAFGKNVSKPALTRLPVSKIEILLCTLNDVGKEVPDLAF